jgi:hypothetical protein
MLSRLLEDTGKMIKKNGGGGWKPLPPNLKEFQGDQAAPNMMPPKL